MVSVRGLLNKPRIYLIEIHAKRINSDIARLLYKTSTMVHDFVLVLETRDIPTKVSYTNSLLEKFLILQSKMTRLYMDVSSIVHIESEKRRYVSIHDDKFLTDKMIQLQVMKENIDAMIEILRENPPNNEYKEGVFEVLLQNFNSFYRSMDRVRRDDAALSKIYAELADM